MNKRWVIALAAACLALAAPVMADVAEGRKAFAAQQFDKAIAELRGPAGNGNAQAQALLGAAHLSIFLDGHDEGGTHVKQAAAWLYKAFDQGDQTAAHYLGVLTASQLLNDAAGDARSDLDAVVDETGQVQSYRFDGLQIDIPKNFEGPVRLDVGEQMTGTAFNYANPLARSISGFVVFSMPLRTDTHADVHAGGRGHVEALRSCALHRLDTVRFSSETFAAGAAESTEIDHASAVRVHYSGEQFGSHVSGEVVCAVFGGRMFHIQTQTMGYPSPADLGAMSLAIELARYRP